MLNHTYLLLAALLFLAADLEAQTQSFKYVASDAGPAEAFGHAVDAEGAYAVVGSRNAVVNGVDMGAAYVFDTTTGQELYKIVPADGASNDKFGFSVAIENGHVLIGCPHHSIGGVSMVGCVYVYDLSSGLEVGRLVPGTLDVKGHFGIGVAAEGNLAAVGGHTRDGAAVDSGEAFVFDWTTGVQLHSLVQNDATTMDRMGWTVAIDNGLVLVGAHYDDDRGTDAGSAYIFDAATGAQVHKLLGNDTSTGDQFGWKLDMEGGLAVVGAHKRDFLGAVDSGAIYVFDVASGSQLAKYRAPDGAANDEFGYGLDLGGTRVAVGAAYSNSLGIDSGAAYVLDVATGALESKIVAGDGAAGDRFGGSVRLLNDILFVGAVADDLGAINDAGSAYQYDLLACTNLYCTVGGGSSSNVTGIGVSGCDLLSPISIDLSNGPPSQFTYLLIGAGSSVVTNPAGAVGDLCVVGGLLSRYRLDLGAISAAGTFTTDISSSASGGPGFGIPSSGGASIQPGETWNFQYWHRNPAGAPSGFSEAVSVAFK
ncbi:MAG: FG-GAP repeat protein [Planctomycetota bacterium]|nr:FG-GAP repeat protein [Planctomycetota bacterium]